MLISSNDICEIVKIVKINTNKISISEFNCWINLQNITYHSMSLDPNLWLSLILELNHYTIDKV